MTLQKYMAKELGIYGKRIRERQGIRTIDAIYHRDVSTKQSFYNLLLLVGFSYSDLRKG